jgi:pSer/pThr/pTyr-binding forkhead associated (FHA) protein
VIQIEVLSGKQAGRTWVARRFPVRIGRSATADLRLEDDGVWEQHIEVALERSEGFILRTQGHALASVNGQPVEQATLRNGDVIGLGALQLRFSLAETRQAHLSLREWLTWVAIGAITLGQIVIIYWLLPGARG